jgi:hypothetical protein
MNLTMFYGLGEDLGCRGDNKIKEVELYFNGP